MEESLPSARSVPTAEEWEVYAERLHALRDAGDTETQDALDLLIPHVEELASDRARGQTYLEPQGPFNSALDDVAERCRAAGSTALQ